MTEIVDVRRAVVSDLPAVLDCLGAAFEPYRDSYTDGAYQDTVPTPATLRRRFESMTVLVAVTPAGGIAGTLSFEVTVQHEGHLRGMAVLPAYVGTGVASRLLMAAEGELRELTCRRITLDTTEPLRRAVRFYERHGYHASGRVRDFHGMPLFEYVKDTASALDAQPSGRAS